MGIYFDVPGIFWMMCVYIIHVVLFICSFNVHKLWINTILFSWWRLCLLVVAVELVLPLECVQSLHGVVWTVPSFCLRFPSGGNLLHGNGHVPNGIRLVD